MNIIIISLVVAGIITYFFDRYTNKKYSQQRTNNQESENGAVLLISFLFPIVGFIIAIWVSLVRHDKNKAKMCAKYAVYGILLNIVLGILFGKF